MEFHEKLQQLRKNNNLTQEQLAEQLFVSRTAISKWESGKGYPNIDSLKNISEFFSVSIDVLLSGEELITLAASENHSNMSKFFQLVYGILDLMAVTFIFLPLYGQQDDGFIHMVTLLEYHDISPTTRVIYWGMLILLSSLGIAELTMQFFKTEKWNNHCRNSSVILHALAILLFILTRQPYVTSFLFMLFMIKVILLIKYALMK